MTTTLANDDYALMKTTDDAGRLSRIPTTALLPPEENYHPRTGILNHPATLLIGAGLVAQGVWTGTFLGVNLWLFWCFLCMGMILFGRRRQMNALRENQRGVALLNAGRVDEAAEIFEALTRSQRGSTSHSVFVFNRGVAYMLQGRLKRAFSLFNSVRRSRHFALLTAHEPTMYVDMATCLALDGALDDAQTFHNKARHAAVGRDAAKLVLSESVILLRRGRVQEARSSIERHLHHAQAELRIPSRRALIVLYAFSLRGPGSNASDAIRSLGIIEPGEFRWLGVSWPEMREFVAQFS